MIPLEMGSVPRPDLEEELRASGYQLIAGIDEAGRGALAGAVVAAAVVLPPDTRIDGLADSKKLTPGQREKLLAQIRSWALGIGVGVVEAETIDRINILQSTLLAMERAVLSLPLPPQFLLVDGKDVPPLSIPSLAVPRGDSLLPSIAAASIVAKVTRDRMMEHYHRLFPWYRFDQHKGYGTAEHLQALKDHGPCPLHRQTFRGVRGYATCLISKEGRDR